MASCCVRSSNFRRLAQWNKRRVVLERDNGRQPLISEPFESILTPVTAQRKIASALHVHAISICTRGFVSSTIYYNIICMIMYLYNISVYIICYVGNNFGYNNRVWTGAANKESLYYWHAFTMSPIKFITNSNYLPGDVDAELLCQLHFWAAYKQERIKYYT